MPSTRTYTTLPSVPRPPLNHFIAESSARSIGNTSSRRSEICFSKPASPRLDSPVTPLEKGPPSQPDATDSLKMILSSSADGRATHFLSTSTKSSNLNTHSASSSSTNNSYHQHLPKRKYNRLPWPQRLPSAAATLAH